MTLQQKLKDQGWNLTEEGLKKLTTELQTEDVKKIISAALDWDFKDIAGGALPIKPENNNGLITGRIVLQVQKMRNISAPKANEESTAAPRFLQLELSDGVNSIVALELERIRDLNLNIPPGTKIYLKGDKLQLIQGLLVLKESEVQILGGKVEHMVEKWEVARQMQKYARSNRRLSGSGSGPPPWIAFGKRLDVHKDSLPQDRNFKSLQAATEKDKNPKENDEFNASRSQAIAEAAKAGQKKVFGGGQQNILDHNVKKILEKGYSEEEAKYALKTTNNNLERALFNLKRRNTRGVSESLSKPATAPSGGGIQRGRGIASAKEEATASKPQTNVSLFDFLTDKLPAATVSTSNTTQAQPQVEAYNSQNARNSKEISKTYNSNSKASSYAAGKFENNMSSSFAANHRGSGPTRSEDKQMQSQPQSHRSSYNQKEDRKPNPFSKQSGRGGGERTRNNVQINEKAPTQATTNDEVASSGTNNNNNAATYGTNSNRRNDRNERPPRKEREQTPRLGPGATGGGYQGNNKRSQDYNKSTDNKSNQPRESNSRTANENRNGNSYQQQTKVNNFENTIDKLAESTSKMSIQNKKESYNSQNRGRHQAASARSSNSSHNQQNASQSKSSNSNQQQSGQFIGSQNFTNKTQAPSQQVVAAPNPQQQQQPQQTYVTQLPNGFSYDPSKIMGFQSKEANEYAMNLLKSQGLLPQQSPVAAPQTQVAPPQQHTQPQIISNPQAPPPPPQAVTYMTQNFVAPPPQQGQMTQYGMMSGGGNWPWNIGDLCLAKYWEDGNYYNAKITAVSENTCVVLFLGYGNHEEVVRTDCLPITDAQHHPINAYQTGGPPAAHAPMQQLPHTTFQGGNPSGGGGNQRYHRSERPMYVPPPKRGNNNN